MKATGIVRRIDDLGRIVIPKEIRRSMKLRENDPLELYRDGEFVCLKKYNPLAIDLEMVKSIFRAALKSSDTIPPLILTTAHEVIAFTPNLQKVMAHCQEKENLVQDAREIGKCESYSPAICRHVQEVNTYVTFSKSAQDFPVGYVRHIFDDNKEYVASLLIAPDELTELDLGIIQTLARVIGAMSS